MNQRAQRFQRPNDLLKAVEGLLKSGLIRLEEPTFGEDGAVEDVRIALTPKGKRELAADKRGSGCAARAVIQGGGK